MKFQVIVVKNLMINVNQKEITVGSATYYAQLFKSRLRRRNILTQRAQIDASFDCEIDAFKLFTLQKLFL